MSDRDPLQAMWCARQTAAMPEVTTDVLRAREQKLASKGARRRWSESIAGATSMAALTAGAVSFTATPWTRGVLALLVIGEAVVLATLWRRGKGRPHPPPVATSTATHLAYYRRELARERDLLQSVAVWYLAPTAPGLVLLPFALCQDFGWSMPWVGGVWTVSLVAVWAILVAVQRHGARRLDLEIAALDDGATP
jgi:hypothetical protein